MNVASKRLGIFILLAASSAGSLYAQQQEPAQPPITVTGAAMPAGPEVKGIISARNDEKIKVTAADRTITIISLSDDTRLNRDKYNSAALLNG